MKIGTKHIGRINVGKKLHSPSLKRGRAKYTLRFWKGNDQTGYIPYPARSRRHESHGFRQQEYSGKSIGSLMRPEHSASSSVLSGNYRNPLRSKYG